MLAESHIYFHKAADVLGLADKVRTILLTPRPHRQGRDRHRGGRRRICSPTRVYACTAQLRSRADEGWPALSPGDG